MAICPVFAQSIELCPCSCVLRCLARGHIGSPFSKRFVKPQVFPPFHGDKIAKPHMRHFVKNCAGTAQVLAFGDLASENQNIFVESYAANIFHCAPVVFSNCKLIVLTEWICQTESFFKVSKTFLGYSENVFSVHVLKERFTGIDPKRNCLFSNIFVVNALVWTSHDGSHIGRNNLGFFELDPFGI